MGYQVQSLVAELSSLKQAFALAKNLREVLDVRERAAALVAATRTGFALRQEIAEIKLRAERLAGHRIGELGIHGGDRRSEHHNCSITLAALGISRQNSHRWQVEASLPEEAFEEWLDVMKAEGRELTSNALESAARRFNANSASGNQNDVAKNQVLRELERLIEAKRIFSCILVTPPWPDIESRGERPWHDDSTEFCTGSLSDLPIKALAADRSHLHFLTTRSAMPYSFRMLNSWDFEYRSLLVCCQGTCRFTRFWRESSSFLLLGVRGDMPFRATAQLDSFECHGKNERPDTDSLRQLIETVSPGPLLHIFSENSCEGWTCVRA